MGNELVSKERLEKSQADGLKTEDVFTALMIKLGYTVKDVSVEVNKKEHIDKICINPDNKGEWSVDVKGIKDFSKCGFPDDTYNILEFNNGYGLEGWLYGKADYIAFETRKTFILVSRKTLLEYATNTSIISPLVINNNKNYPNPTICDAYHKIFMREMFKKFDRITVVLNTELEDLAEIIFKK